MRAVFDKNVPVGVRRFLTVHEMPTFVEVQWHPQLENGELLRATEAARFDVMVTSDQNIVYQQNLTGRKLALVVLGSNIWPVVRGREKVTDAFSSDTSAVENMRRRLFRYSRPMELIFEIRDADEGGLCARALGHSIFTQAESWDELRANVLEAVSLHFEDADSRPRLVQMHYVKDELIALEAA